MIGVLVETTAVDSEVKTLLNHQTTYAERPSSVECIETHISWVFLAGRYVYKLKKPVRYEFLDFSTPALRHAACIDEVRLNRRLAPGVYRKVMPVTESGGRLTLNGAGTPVDWVVQMQRLPAAAALDRQLQDGTITDQDTARLATTLATFYAQALPLTIRPQQYRDEIQRHVRANLKTLCELQHGIPPRWVQRACAAQLRFLKTTQKLLDARVCDGRIVEGHGDLRPEHIYLTRRPVVIDCIEFSKEFRTLDVADELAFLAMECDRLGAPAPGEEILQKYRDISGDRPPAILLDFYKCYRACVRAKVHALRAAQLDGDESDTEIQQQRSYLSLADRYASGLGPAHVIVVRGLMGVGKSTLATALADALGCELLQTDAIRRERYPATHDVLAYGEGAYQADQRRCIYDELLRRAADGLGDRLSIIVDGAFLTNDLRDRAGQLAQRLEAVMLDVHCHCPPDVAKARLQHRIASGQGLSDARPDLYDRQRADEEPAIACNDVVHVDTMTSVAAQVDQVIGRLADRLRLANGIA